MLLRAVRVENLAKTLVEWKYSNFDKVYQVGTSRKGKIETNTIRLFLDWFNTSEKTYSKFKQKKVVIRCRPAARLCLLLEKVMKRQWGSRRDTKKRHILTLFLDFYPGKSWNNSLTLIPSCLAVVQLSLCKFCWYANEINLLKSSKTWFFWPIFDPKIDFLRFYPGKLRVITSKLLLIDSTVKNTSRKVYLESLAYRAENARKSFY